MRSQTYRPIYDAASARPSDWSFHYYSMAVKTVALILHSLEIFFVSFYLKRYNSVFNKKEPEK
jgi:hypothetical protein